MFPWVSCVSQSSINRKAKIISVNNIFVSFLEYLDFKHFLKVRFITLDVEINFLIISLDMFWILPRSGHDVCCMLGEMPLRNAIKSLITAPSTWKRKFSIYSAVKPCEILPLIITSKIMSKYLQLYACAISQKSFPWSTTTDWCRIFRLWKTNNVAPLLHNFNLINLDIQWV